MLPNKYVLIWNGQPVGVDSNSGGYPFKTDSPSQVRYFDSREEAEKYLRVFENSRSYGFYTPMVEIHEIQFRIVG